MVIDSFSNFASYKPRENDGSRSTNRLLMQVSFAFLKIMDLYNKHDFIIVMDCIDDVAVLNTSSELPNLTTYQLKTKDNGLGDFPIKALANDQVFLKIYDHIEQIEGTVKEIYLITNIPLKLKKKIAKEEYIKFNNLDTEMQEIIKENMSKSKLFKKHGLSEKFVYSIVNMSVTSHREIVESKFMQFLIDRKIDMHITATNATCVTVLDILTKKQAKEFSKKDSMPLLIEKKGFSKKDFDKLLSDTESLETIDYQDIKDKYFPEMNLFKELKYSEALANMKSKCIEYPKILEEDHEKVTKFIIDKISKVTDRKQLITLMKEELFLELTTELSEIEKEVFCMNKIEYFLKKGGK
ncbi:dsDNA nuclease domain-containing protein [Peribacillus butanolivorans]|uniref:Lamassu anti-phage system protein LmuA n=1 Tax=Peribacillus butanolivorans TaxID=421767 RepID=UPI003D2CFABA